MIHTFENINGTVVADTDRYKLIDNTDLKNMVLSKTILHVGQETRGHVHPGQEEVYFFVSGTGRMTISDADSCKIFDVTTGSVIQIPDGVFHKVVNTSDIDLEFICVFDGNRNH